MLPLGPPDRYGSPYKARSAFAAWPGLLAEPAAPVAQGRGARLPRARGGVDRGLGALRRPRRGRRPGALRARVDGAARLRERARRAADRRRADLRRARLGRPPRPPRAVPRRRRRRHAAGRLHRQGPAVGQPALRLAGAAAARLPLVDRAAGAHVRALRPRADRPLPRLRRLLGGAAGRAPRAGGPLAPRARAARCSTRAGAALGELPLIAEDLGVITPPVERLRDGLGLPGMVVLQFGLARARRATCTTSPTTASTGSPTPARTTTTRCAAGTSRCRPRRARAVDATRPRAARRGLVGPDRARLLLPRPGRDGAGAGRARAGERGADEPAGHAAGRVEVAARRAAVGASWRSGCARRPRPPGASRHRGRRLGRDGHDLRATSASPRRRPRSGSPRHRCRA